MIATVIGDILWLGLLASVGGGGVALPSVYDNYLGDRPGIFRQANELYEEGKLAEAEAGYRFLIATGAANGYVHYNLGNTYFRRGHLGRAILEYERAIEYLPRHPDVRHNLQFVRELMVDEELKPKIYGGTLGFVLGLHSGLNLREGLIGLLGLAWLLGIAYVIRILFPDLCVTRHTGWVRGLLVTLFVFGVLSVGVKVYRAEHRDQAVILATASEVKTGPGGTYSTAFTLHEGTIVRVGLQRPDWVRIRLANGLTGWIEGKDLEVI